MSVFIPRLWWIDLVGRIETMKPWHARFKCCHMRCKITECWLTETADIFVFLKNEGTSGNQEGVINWCRFNLLPFVATIYWFNLTEWSSLILLTVFRHICGTITSQQFCHAERSFPPREKTPRYVHDQAKRGTQRLSRSRERAFLGLPSPRWSYKSYNTIDSQQDNRSVLCGWSVCLSLKLLSTFRSWKKILPVA